MPTTLPIYVDTEALAHLPYNPDLREKFRRFEKLLLVVSRLEGEKGVDRAIRVLPEVLRTTPTAGLVIVGEGSRRRDLVALAQRLRVAHAVSFEGWQTPGPYYAIADMLLNTSHYEGFGLSLVEALAAGLPVLSFDVGVAQEAGASIVAEGALAQEIIARLKKPKGVGVLRLPLPTKRSYLESYAQALRMCATQP